MSLGRQPPPKPEPGVQELASDPLVVTDRVGQQGHVAAGRLAHLGHRVDEADLGGQEGVGRGLDQLGGGEVADHRRRLLTQRDRVDLPQQAERGPVVGAEDQPVRTQGVLDRERLPQELGVPGQVDGVAGRGQLAVEAEQPGRGADRDGGLADDQGRPLQQRRQPPGDGLQLAQVGRTVRALRCAQTQEVDVGPVGDVGEVGGEPQPARGGVPLQHRLQVELVHRRPAGVELLDPGRVDVDADHLVAELGHPGRVGRAEIAGADDADPQGHATILPKAGRSAQTDTPPPLNDSR